MICSIFVNDWAYSETFHFANSNLSFFCLRIALIFVTRERRHTNDGGWTAFDKADNKPRESRRCATSLSPNNNEPIISHYEAQLNANHAGSRFFLCWTCILVTDLRAFTWHVYVAIRRVASFATSFGQTTCNNGEQRKGKCNLFVWNLCASQIPKGAQWRKKTQTE